MSRQSIWSALWEVNVSAFRRAPVNYIIGALLIYPFTAWFNCWFHGWDQGWTILLAIVAAAVVPATGAGAGWGAGALYKRYTGRHFRLLEAWGPAGGVIGSATLVTIGLGAYGPIGECEFIISWENAVEGGVAWIPIFVLFHCISVATALPVRMEFEERRVRRAVLHKWAREDLAGRTRYRLYTETDKFEIPVACAVSEFDGWALYIRGIEVRRGLSDMAAVKDISGKILNLEAQP